MGITPLHHYYGAVREEYWNGFHKLKTALGLHLGRLGPAIDVQVGVTDRRHASIAAAGQCVGATRFLSRLEATISAPAKFRSWRFSDLPRCLLLRRCWAASGHKTPFAVLPDL
jgi:hypothetical protein